MAFQREGVLLFARDAEFFGQDLGGRSHNKAADGIGQPHFQSDARLEIRRPQTDQGLQFLGQCFGPSQMGQDILQFFAEIKRDIAHRLRSPGDVAIPLPQLDFHRGLYGRFDAGSAVAVDGVSRHGFGDAAQEGDHPGDVGGVRRLADVAEDHFVDLPRVDTGTFQKLPRGDAPEFLGVEVPELRAHFAERGADAVYDGNAVHGYKLVTSRTGYPDFRLSGYPETLFLRSSIHDPLLF